MKFFIFASDADNALEVAGNGADVEFESLEHVKRDMDPDFHGGKKLFSVEVEEVKLPD